MLSGGFGLLCIVPLPSVFLPQLYIFLGFSALLPSFLSPLICHSVLLILLAHKTNSRHQKNSLTFMPRVLPDCTLLLISWSTRKRSTRSIYLLPHSQMHCALNSFGVGHPAPIVFCRSCSSCNIDKINKCAEPNHSECILARCFSADIFQ